MSVKRNRCERYTRIGSHRRSLLQYNAGEEVAIEMLKCRTRVDKRNGSNLLCLQVPTLESGGWGFNMYNPPPPCLHLILSSPPSLVGPCGPQIPPCLSPASKPRSGGSPDRERYHPAPALMAVPRVKGVLPRGSLLHVLPL